MSKTIKVFQGVTVLIFVGNLVICGCYQQDESHPNFCSNVIEASDAFYSAAKKSDEQKLRDMIQAGMDINGCQTETPLAKAIRLGDENAVTLLLKYGADVNLVCGTDGITSLHEAAIDGNDAIVKVLLQCGANVNAKDAHGATPLFYAAACSGKIGEELEVVSNSNVVKLLLAFGAHVNQVENDGSTVLLAAFAMGDDEVIRLLVENGADINARIGEDNRTLLHYVVEECSGPCLVSYLIKQGADLNACDIHGKTPLDVAIAKGNREEIVGLLRGVSQD